TIAAILALEPKVLILDEPTAGQDYKRYKEFMEFIKSIASQGVGIILITHDEELAKSAKRIIRVQDGKIIYDN
ncbi:MAG: heme ABC transporter ATP-binding protein, partial [Oscillospiraceae bacterium]